MEKWWWVRREPLLSAVDFELDSIKSELLTSERYFIYIPGLVYLDYTSIPSE